MKRRTFLISSVAAGAAAGSGWWIATEKVTPEKLNALLEADLPMDDSIRTIGNLYLNSRNDPDLDTLTRELLQRIKGTRASNLAEALREAVLEDFTIENTTVLEGWILSTTELELCGLRLLLASQQPSP